MRGCRRGSNELFINKAREEAYHAQKKKPAKNISKWFIWDTEDCPRSRTESGDNNGCERGFSIPALRARARELSKLIAIQSELGATRMCLMEAVRPRGSSVAGSACGTARQGPAEQ